MMVELLCISLDLLMYLLLALGIIVLLHLLMYYLLMDPLVLVLQHLLKHPLLRSADFVLGARSARVSYVLGAT